MKKIILFLMWPLMATGQTLQECQEAARRNYPLIRQYDLTSQTTALAVDNLQKEWLPQLTAQAQATLQSDVARWPDEMQALMQQMGVGLKGLRKDQYRVGVDVSQTVLDGGAIRMRQEVARRQGQVEQAQTETTLYAVRQRVNDLFFSLLMLDEQLLLNQDRQELLASSERKLQAMFRRGTAAESDLWQVKAERTAAEQQTKSLRAQRQLLAAQLSMLCGMEVAQPQKPEPPNTPHSDMATKRPELRAIEAQLLLADAQERLLDTALKPRLNVFASGFYGYPGYNMFNDMMHHRWTLNGMIGARLTWNIGALYTRRNDKARIEALRQQANVRREVFLFNNRLEQTRQQADMERFRQLMADDEEIIQLREAVRKAAESKLAHGIIDTNDLVAEINRENAARVQQAMHELQMLKEMYDLIITTNQ